MFEGVLNVPLSIYATKLSNLQIFKKCDKILILGPFLPKFDFNGL